MPHQAEWLIQKMKADTSIDFENDWKVVTIFIGGNDLCAWCRNIEYYSSDNYVKFISEALMILHDNVITQREMHNLHHEIASRVLKQKKKKFFKGMIKLTAYNYNYINRYADKGLSILSNGSNRILQS